MKTLPANYRSGDELEQGVLSELNGRASPANFKSALEWYEKTLEEADQLAKHLEELRAIGKKSRLLPEFESALSKILKDHPTVERVSLSKARYANLGQGRSVDRHMGKVGGNVDEILRNISTDLDLVRTNLRDTIKEFKAVIHTSESGGLAAVILSGRASFPELVMQGEDMMTIFVRYYGQACMTTIGATMLVYPKGLEFLPQPPRK